MATPLDSVTILLAGLTTGNNCRATLEQLRVLLVSVSVQELKDYVPKIDVDRLFTCLTTTDREQIRLTCEVLSIILGCLPAGKALTKHEDLFLEGLIHAEDQVKNMILHQLQRIADDDHRALLSHSDLILSCLRLMGSDDLNTASNARRIFTSLCSKADDSSDMLISPPVINEVKLIAASNDIIRYRIYEIMILLCCTSDSKLSSIDATGLLQPLLSDVNSDDILIQLNALELLGTLVVHQHGREYLLRNETIRNISDQLSRSLSDPLASLTSPGLMKFLGIFVHSQPDRLSQLTAFTDTLLRIIEDSEMSLQIVAIETVSFIATETRGKKALQKVLGERMEKIMKRLGSLLSNSNSEVRLKALHSVGELVNIPADQLEDEELLKLVEEWLKMLDPRPIQLIMNLIKQPFKEFRFELLTILLNLSPQQWAQKLMSFQPGFVEFLLDRGAEPDKECTECKFQIVEKLAECHDSTDVWTDYTISQIREHVRQGAWFVRAQANVAFESGP